jgi:hypothetical protein
MDVIVNIPYTLDVEERILQAEKLEGLGRHAGQ